MPVAEAELAETEISAYMLPDGSLLDLCHTLDHDGEKPHPDRHALTPVCKLCRIVAGIFLPQPADLTGMALVIETAQGFPSSGRPFFWRPPRSALFPSDRMKGVPL